MAGQYWVSSAATGGGPRGRRDARMTAAADDRAPGAGGPYAAHARKREDALAGRLRAWREAEQRRRAAADHGRDGGRHDP